MFIQPHSHVAIRLHHQSDTLFFVVVSDILSIRHFYFANVFKRSNEIVTSESAWVVYHFHHSDPVALLDSQISVNGDFAMDYLALLLATQNCNLLLEFDHSSSAKLISSEKYVISQWKGLAVGVLCLIYHCVWSATFWPLQSVDSIGQIFITRNFSWNRL